MPTSACTTGRWAGPSCRGRVKPIASSCRTCGTTAAAQPAAPMQADTYAALSTDLCDRLRAALPVDVVILFLHGAMASQDCLDCEGDILERLRAIAGPQMVIGAVLDPHAHL